MVLCSHRGEYVVVVGGAAMDIAGFPAGALRLLDSNPGVMRTSLGGVGRNIAENLARLGVDVKMLTALGDDDFGRRLRGQSEQTGIDFAPALVIDNASTATYLAIMDEQGDMQVAIASMDVFAHITIDYIRSHDALLRCARAIVLDANLSQTVIEFIAQEYRTCPLFVDAVSSLKAAKLKDVLGSFHAVKPNKQEAEFLSGLIIDTPDDLVAVKNWFMAQGVKSVFISLGRSGVFYGDALTHAESHPAKLKIVSATGAGDAFMAGLVYGYLRKLTLTETVDFAQAMATLTACAHSTVHPQMSVALVESSLPRGVSSTKN